MERSIKRLQTNPHLPFPSLDLATNRRSGGTIIATRRDTYKEVTAIPTPSHIGDYISAATLTPYDGSPIIAISAYMPQLHTKNKGHNLYRNPNMDTRRNHIQILHGDHTQWWGSTSHPVRKRGKIIPRTAQPILQRIRTETFNPQ